MEESRDNGIKNVFIREFARAIPWGIVIIITALICFSFIGYGGKKLIDHAQRNAANIVRQIVTDKVLVEGIKRNIKEGIEYTKKEVKSVLMDPELKQDVKEALEYTGNRK